MINCQEGQHDKAFDTAFLLSHPPQRRWICRECLAEGTETMQPDDQRHLFIECYEEAKNRKALKQAEKLKHATLLYDRNGGL